MRRFAIGLELGEGSETVIMVDVGIGDDGTQAFHGPNGRRLAFMRGAPADGDVVVEFSNVTRWWEVDEKGARL